MLTWGFPATSFFRDCNAGNDDYWDVKDSIALPLPLCSPSQIPRSVDDMYLFVPIGVLLAGGSLAISTAFPTFPKPVFPRVPQLDLLMRI